MKKRLTNLFWLYLTPLIGMCAAPLLNTFAINGEPLNFAWMMFVGFIFGMVIDGFLLTILATCYVITEKLDWSSKNNEG